MAIAIDSTQTFTQTSSTTHNVTFNNVAGDFLIVGFNNTSGSGDVVSSVTYNGVALTEVATHVVPNNNFSSVWYLANPATGSNTLAISYSGSSDCRGAVQSYTGVDLTSPIDASASGTSSWNTTTNIDLPITTNTSNTRLFANSYIARSITAYDSGTTSVYYQSGASSTVRSTNEIASAGATQLGWTANNNEYSGYVIVALKEDAGGGGVVTPQFIGFGGL